MYNNPNKQYLIDSLRTGSSTLFKSNLGTFLILIYSSIFTLILTQYGW